MIKIVEIIRRLMRQLMERVFYDAAVDHHELMQTTYHLHNKVYNAILDRDPERAKKSMQDHLGDIMKRIMNSDKF